MNIAIVDDDPIMSTQLHTNLSDLLGDEANIICFPSGEAFLASYRPGLFDLIILDIFMKEITGMDAARKIRESDQTVRIVFSTSSNDFASESYEVNACYYLKKPYGTDQLRSMLDRLNLEEMERMRTIRLPDGSRVVLRQILYADFASRRVTLHCKDGDNRLLASPFSEVEALLCAYPCFISPFKGIIVNFHEVESLTPDMIRLSDGSPIPISRRKSKEVLEAYFNFRFDTMRRQNR